MCILPFWLGVSFFVFIFFWDLRKKYLQSCDCYSYFVRANQSYSLKTVSYHHSLFPNCIWIKNKEDRCNLLFFYFYYFNQKKIIGLKFLDVPKNSFLGTVLFLPRRQPISLNVLPSKHGCIIILSINRKRQE